MHIPPIIKRFPPNTRGRDFVVGDIHGCFPALREALQQQQFKPSQDRLFSVGDLVDRGPRSEDALHWLGQDWFHSCLGNHEECLLNFSPDKGEDRRWFERHGGEWWLTQGEQDRQAVRTALASLPLTIEIESPLGRVGLVHAELPDGLDWQGFIRQLELGDSASYQSALWGRKRIKRLFGSKIKGIDQVVCGHSIPKKKQVLHKGNIWFIETGAYKADSGGSLSLLNIDSLFRK